MRHFRPGISMTLLRLDCYVQLYTVLSKILVQMVFVMTRYQDRYFDFSISRLNSMLGTRPSNSAHLTKRSWPCVKCWHIGCTAICDEAGGSAHQILNNV